MKKENYDENVVGEPIKVFAVRNMSKAIFVIIFAHQIVIWYLTIFWWKKIRIRCINLSIAFGEQ